MTIGEIVSEGLYYARTCRSLWLFGFFVGIATGGSNGGGGGGGGQGGGAGAAAGVIAGRGVSELPGWGLALLLGAVLLLVVAGFVLRFVGEGALIEGIARVRRGGAVTTGQGFRSGWANWGVLVRIGLLYFAVLVASVALLVGLVVLALRASGPLAAFAVGLPGAIVAVPWLITLHLIQAFAARIAVLEERSALEAIRRARLFLHGRIAHGLRLMVASFLGTLMITAIAFIVVVPVVVLLAALAMVLPLLPLIVTGALVLTPVSVVLTAVLGTFRSSVWTIGYVTQAES